MSGKAVGGGAATWSIAALTWIRLWRGRAVWVSVVLAAVPIVMANVFGRQGGSADDVIEVSIMLLGILPALHLAASLSEELEDRTAAYLWSRPIARWTIVTGKLLALGPFVALLSIGGAVAAARTGVVGPAASLDRVALGLGLGVIAASCFAVGISTIWPKHGMSVSMVLLLFVDIPIGAIPASLANLSITHHVRSIVYAHGAVTARAVIGLVAIAAVWLVVALARIRRLE